MDGTALAHLLRQKEVTSEQVRAAAEAAVDAVNPMLNAVVGEALPPARDHDTSGEFAGVPFAIKDLVCHAAGVLHESGSELCQGFIPDYDTDLMSRWGSAGLVTIYRTTTPEFGLSCSTESRATGITRNPWDVQRSPGGSSGGSAALVAAGALPWAHANDAAGSNRIPAALCGLVGLKPTRGRIPPGPDSDDPLFGTSTEFAITRTVRDTAALLDAVEGPEPGDRISIGRPKTRFRDARLGGRQQLRIAYSTRSRFGGKVDPSCAQAVQETAATLAGMGHILVEDHEAFDPDEFIEMISRFWSASVSETVKAYSAGRPQALVRHLLQGTTRNFASRGDELRWQEIAEARSWQNRLTRATGSHFTRYDVQLSPTVARPAWPVGVVDADDATVQPEQWIRQLFDLAPFTALYNVTGQPAISVPALLAGGLPVGVQISSSQGKEDLLIGTAFALEEARPWNHHRPHIHAAAKEIRRPTAEELRSFSHSPTPEQTPQAHRRLLP